eukprot:8412953-Ditylum_brightwellii.AAC.1
MDDHLMEGVDKLQICLICWLLQKQGADGTRLITSIKQGPYGVQYFCAPSEKKDELIEHIDNLDSILCPMFEYEALDDALNRQVITCKFKKFPLKNTAETLTALTKFLLQSPLMGNKYAHVENCWKHKLCLQYFDTEGDDAGRMDDGEEVSSKREDEVGKLDKVGDSKEMETSHYKDDAAEYIQELAHWLDEQDRWIKFQKEIINKEKQAAELNPQQDEMLQTLLKRTAQLEAKATCSSSGDILSPICPTYLPPQTVLGP